MEVADKKEAAPAVCSIQLMLSSGTTVKECSELVDILREQRVVKMARFILQKEEMK